MACTVNTKDIQREVKQQFLNLDGVRPTPSGVFENFSHNNPDSMSTKFSDKIKELRQTYQENTYGKMLTVSTEQYGTRVDINPTQALADAMTAQNEADEKITQRAEASNIQRADAQRAGVQYEDDYLFDSRRVDYTLKAVNILSTPKAEEIFKRGDKNNWTLDKILTELQVPKEQKQLIVSKRLTNREEIITSLLGDNSFVVEINISKRFKTALDRKESLVLDEYGNAVMSNSNEEINSDFYSNLTVPGGTNYTENEIATPAITPSIKGHAQFSTDNGIGWFRSDEKVTVKTNDSNTWYIVNPELGIQEFNSKEEAEEAIKQSGWGNAVVTNDLSNDGLISGSKTRRILEVQSDLFQKGRDRKNLVNSKIPTGELETIDFDDDGRPLPSPIMKDNLNYERGNQFLQLLNKDNNWVTFFVKSIIQDSSKKGYEKVLFPKGDTAAKIEGHQTLEEFKKQKESRIKELEEDIKNINVLLDKKVDAIGNPFEEGQQQGYENKIIQKNNEINQLKQELERVDTEGFAALKPIYNFYENTVANILKKNYDITEITDKYGNKWNEVDLSQEQNQSSEIFLSRRNSNPSNNIQPQGNNYVEFVRYKKERLESINNELGRLNFTLKNSNLGSNIDVVEINNRIKALEKESSIISRQLEALSKDESKYMFHAIEEDLNNLEKVLDSNNIFDINKVNSRLDFLEEFISGTNKEFKGQPLSEYNNPAFGVIAGKIKELQVKATQRIMEVSRNSIENSSLVQNLVSENPDLDTDNLFQAQKDLNWLETWTLGVTADRTNNTVIPQALYALLRNTLTRKQSTVESWNKQLKALVDANPDLKNPDFIKEKDSSGNETGFIVNLFSPAYYKAMVKYKKLIDNFISDSNQENYNKVVTELLQHNNVIDFTRIQAVKDLYGSTYPDYFTSSEENMDKYEESLRKGLGPKYDEVINQILNRLALFEEKKIDALSEGGQYVSRDLASQDIWKFNEIMKSPNKYSKVAYSHEGQIYGVLFKDFNNVTFLPKETISKEVMTDEGPILLKENTGYYNEAFKDIANSPSKLEYWNLIKKMSEYISSTYDAQTYGRLSYPKIQKEYAERLQEGLKDKNIGSIITNSAKEYKSWFYERGRFKDGKTIAPNYVESFESDVKKLARTYILQGIDREDAYTKARKEILDTYSDDFNSNMIAVAMEAALHDARLEVQPMSEAYIKYFKSIGPERENAIKKLEHFYEKIILNTNEKYRDSGKTEGKGLSEGTWLNRMLALMQKVPYLNRIINEKSTYLLSDAEAKIFEQLKLIQKEGRTSADYSFSLDGITYIQKKGRTYESMGENVQEISQEYFQENFELHIQEEINKLGLDLNLAGGINGILKTIIFKGLALNPISGIFNRIEGKHSAMIMDATGEYWTTGNIDVANNLMSFANITRLSKGRLSPVMAKRKETLQIFDTLMKQFNILQDRKNELQRSAEEAKFDRELLNPYMFAVENPEYKNQGAIIMAVLMDKKVTDVNGNVVPLLNKETGEFTIYTLNNGRLELKPEFQTPENIEAYQKFKGTTIQNLVLKMTDAVSRSQGNYDSLDIMMAKKSIWGRAATLFMTWFAEHINQRFGVSGDKNYNLNTGKKRRHGRFIEAYKSNKLNTMIGAVTGLTVSYGLGGPLLLAMGVGGLGFMVYKKFVGNIAGPKAIKRDINYAMELLEFTKSLMIESLNYPGRILNINSKLKINNNSFEGTNMSKDEIAAMRALTRELAIVLTWLGVKLAMGALLYDDDDDKESPQRMKHNFIQNQLSRAINALTIYSNPQELISDQSRMAALETLSSAGKVLMAAFNEKQREDLGKNFLDLTPIPRILVKGRMPYHDKMNYDEMSNFSGIPSPMKWTSEFFKNYSAGPERQAEKDYKKILKELRKDLKEEYMSKHKGKKAPLKDELDALIKEKISGYKKKEQTYQEKLKQVESLDLD